jgi:hypothetical protein
MPEEVTVARKGRYEILRTYNYGYNKSYTRLEYILYKTEIIFPHSRLHFQHIFSTFAWGATLKSERQVRTSQKLKQRTGRFRPNKKRNQILPLHDSARPRNSLPKMDAVATVVWTVLAHPSYSPDLAPSDLHIFGCVKDALRGCRFAEVEGLKQREWRAPTL